MANVVKFANIGTTRGAGGERLSIVSILKFFSKNERERVFETRNPPRSSNFRVTVGKIHDFPRKIVQFSEG